MALTRTADVIQLRRWIPGYLQGLSPSTPADWGRMLKPLFVILKLRDNDKNYLMMYDIQ